MKKNRKKTSKKRVIKSQVADYDYHLPVLLEEAVSYLINEKFINDINAIFIDGTLGGGGHAAFIMQKIRGKIFAFDKDISAINRANIMFEEELKKPSPRIVLHNKSFSKACSIVQNSKSEIGCNNSGENITPNGILLDLGVSSMQLDSAQGGISYRVDSPLDMRFDSESRAGENNFGGNYNPTAKDILNSKSEDELTTIFRNYGEEPKSRAIARRIVEVRRVKTLETTYDLRAIIEDCVPKVHHFKALSRIFQAIRIEVNQELEELLTTLKDIINILSPGGRIVVISYHSLEDRIVKQIFKENSFTVKTNKYADNNFAKELDNSVSNTVPDISNNFTAEEILANSVHAVSDNKQNTITTPKLKLLTVKPIIPSEEEIKRNPRARSAKMRVAEKV